MQLASSQQVDGIVAWIDAFDNICFSLVVLDPLLFGHLIKDKIPILFFAVFGIYHDASCIEASVATHLLTPDLRYNSL